MADFVSESPALPGSPVERPTSPLLEGTRLGSAVGALATHEGTEALSVDDMPMTAVRTQSGGLQEEGSATQQELAETGPKSSSGTSGGEKGLEMSRGTSANGSGGSLVSMLLQVRQWVGHFPSALSRTMHTGFQGVLARICIRRALFFYCH